MKLLTGKVNNDNLQVISVIRKSMVVTITTAFCVETGIDSPNFTPEGVPHP